MPAADTRPPATRIEPGDPLPDIKVLRLDGGAVQLGAYKGKLLLLVAASYSSPVFRERTAAAFEKIRREQPGRVTVVFLYTAEAHPAGTKEPFRNQEAAIVIPAHKTIEDRLRQAKSTRDLLKITANIIVDPIDDPVQRATSIMPGGALLVDRNGVVLVRQDWADASAMERHIEDAIRAAAEAARRPASRPSTRP